MEMSGKAPWGRIIKVGFLIKNDYVKWKNLSCRCYLRRYSPQGCALVTSWKEASASPPKTQNGAAFTIVMVKSLKIGGTWPTVTMAMSASTCAFILSQGPQIVLQVEGSSEGVGVAS